MLHNGKSYVAYVDFIKVFDAVQRPILWNILLRAAIKGIMMKVVNMYSAIKTLIAFTVSSKGPIIVPLYSPNS